MKLSVFETFKLQDVLKIGQREGRAQGRIRQLIAIPLCIVAAVGVVLLVIGMYPADLPGQSSPNFVDVVFDNRGVIWAARLLLVSATAVLAFGGVFIVASIAIRMKNGEWLRRAGPFEVSEVVGAMESQVKHWREVALAGEEEVAELTEQLIESEELVEQLRGGSSIERNKA